jgi:glycosyltransferase involved in cell wall biosynthesis
MGQKRKRPVTIIFNAVMLQNHLGGIGNYAFNLLKALRRVRPEWRLILLTHSGIAPSFLALEGVEVRSLSLKSRALRLLWLHFCWPLSYPKADLLHSIGNMGVPFSPIPQAITLHDTYEFVSPERFSARKRFFMKMLVRLSGWRARVILTDSQNTLKDIKRFYPSLFSKALHVPLGTKYAVGESSEADGRSGFLFVGTLEPGKNLPLILKSYAKSAAHHPHRLKVAGAKGWEISDLPRLANALEVSDRVDWMGYVNEKELEDLYRNSLALIMASNYEGYGLPALEAASLGCHPILARNSSLPEAGGDGALYFTTGSSDELAECLVRIHTDSELRKNLRKKGLAHAQGFTWEKTAEMTAKAFEK